MIASEAGADLFKLISDDGHYPENFIKLQRTAQWDAREQVRPAYSGSVPDFSKYKTIFVGGPTWYLDWPMIVYAFLEDYDFSGKVIAPFTTFIGHGADLSGTLAGRFPKSNVKKMLQICAAETTV